MQHATQKNNNPTFMGATLNHNQSKSAFDRCTLEEVRDALQYIDSHERDTWVRMGMAIKHEFGQAGFDVWDLWSQQAANYQANAAKATWRSIKVSGAGDSVRIGSLFKEAMGHGWKPAQSISNEEKARREAEWESRRKVREQEWAEEEANTERWYDRVKELAAYVWQQLGTSGKSPYLGTKRIKDYGIRFAKAAMIIVTDEEAETVRIVQGREAIQSFYQDRDESLSFLHIKPGVIAVPLFDLSGQIWNIQFIFQGGKKRFMKHGRKSGLFHVLGTTKCEGPLIFAEGYSTGASVHEAVGQPVVIAMDCGNLLPVARQWRQRYPDRLFVFAADNDLDTEGNPGIRHAQEAANDLGGYVWPAPEEALV